MALAQQALENLCGDFAKKTPFEIKKPTSSMATLRDPTHQL